MKKLMLTLLTLAATATAQAQLVINELMQSNIDCIMDDLNDFPDSWVELYNNGTTTVNLNQYKLGKNNKANKAWVLPNRTLAPGQYAIIYCDKVGEEASSGLHTDFRLESGKGCEVWLFKGSEVADHVEGLAKQPAPNIAYGRKTDGSDTWGYQLTPTPGAANCGETTSNILGEPVFSQKGCVFTSSQLIQLTLSVPEGSPEGTIIRYTNNGTEPTLTNGNTYTSPINISANRIIRAKLFCDGWLSPRATAQSYIFFPTTRQLTLPVISITTNQSYLNDAQIGIYTDAYTNGKHNYEYNWRRPITLEYFENAGEAAKLNQLCETRIMGGATRGNPLKSMAIYANKRFGTKRFEYEFFPDQRPGVTDFKSLALRNSGNDFDYLYQRDPIIQRTMAQHTDLDWQAWRPAIVYINGTYRGMLNIRERSNEDNIYTNYDGLEDIDMFENWWELKEGDWDNYNAFKAFYAEHGHTLAEYAEWMDWEEFFNLMIMNAYFMNCDFPGNNIVMWRPKATGGKWRWIAKDTDFGLGLYGQDVNFNYFAWLNNPDYDSSWRNWANQWEHTRLFRRMMEDNDLKREFIDRFAIYMGDFLNEQGTRAVWDPMYDMIKTEYPFHRALFNAWWPDYNSELNTARTWLKNRTANVYQHMKSYYQLGTIVPMTVNKDLSADELAQVNITFNGIKLTKGKFDGKFYAGRTVTLKGTQTGNKEVKSWKVILAGSNAKTEVYDGAECSFTIPSGCSQVIVTATLTDATAITQQAADTHTVHTDNRWYTIDGRMLNSKPTAPGIYIHNGQKVNIK